MGFENFQPASHWSITSDLEGHGGLFISVVLLAFLTLLLLGFLFFRFVCFRERNLSRITSPTMTRIAQHTISIPAAATPSISLGLDDTTINNLPIFMHKKSSSVCPDDIDDASFRESECSICLGLYEDEEMVKVMPECMHSFHSDCVDEWLRNRSTCPLCRLSLDSSSTESVLSP